MGPDQRRRLLSAALCAVLLAGCGSTLTDYDSKDPGGGQAQGTNDGLGTSDATPAPDATATDGTDTSSGTTGGTTTGGGGGGSDSTTGSTGGGTGGATSSPTTDPVDDGDGGSFDGSTSGSAPTSKAPGVTATTIKVGLIKVVNGDALNSAAGAGGITHGDDQQNDDAVIKDINAHGGIAGRKLVGVYADFDSTSSQTLDQQYAALCQKFTRDTPVFAVVGGANESYRSCIAKAGIAFLDDDLPSVGTLAFKKYPGFLELGYPNLDRLAAYEATSLQEQGYFSPWNPVTNRAATTGKAKVGILTYNDTVFSHAVDGFLVPALKRLGYTPVVEKIAQVNTAADYGSQAASVKSAQLAFASNGVTHIIPFESNGGLSLFFLPTAKSQAYYPRYGMNSASGFQALLDSGVTDADQLHGALGFGWLPNLDMPDAFNPDSGKYSNAERRRCLAVFKASGITFSSSNASSIGLAVCAVMTLLKKALDPIPTHVTFSAFLTQVDKLGTSYQPAASLGIDLAPHRHDPTNKAYHLHLFTDCGCFRYDGTLRTIP